MELLHHYESERRFVCKLQLNSLISLHDDHSYVQGRIKPFRCPGHTYQVMHSAWWGRIVLQRNMVFGNREYNLLLCDTDVGWFEMLLARTVKRHLCTAKHPEKPASTEDGQPLVSLWTSTGVLRVPHVTRVPHCLSIYGVKC